MGYNLQRQLTEKWQKHWCFFSMLFMAIHFEATLGFPGKEEAQCQPTHAPCTYHRPDQQEECCEPDICREDSDSVLGGLCGFLKVEKVEKEKNDDDCLAINRSCVLPNPVLPDQQGDCCDNLRCCSCPSCPGHGKCSDIGACQFT